jgi:uncharacterized membrane protein
MGTPHRRESNETDRLLALSDGVVAIAITLLVLELTVPEVPPGTPTAAVPTLVFEQWHEFVGYVLSFLVIGSYWVNHRRIFVHIERHDRGVVWLNLVFLLVLAFVPFASSMFATYPNQFGVMFLAGALALTGLCLTLLWSYASRQRLLKEGLASRTVQIQAARFLASPFVFVLSIGVAAFDPGLGILTWLLLVPINVALQSRLADSLEAPIDRSEDRSDG